MTVRFTRDTVLRRRDEIMRRWEAIVVGAPRGIVLAGSLLRDALPDLINALAESLEQTDAVVTPLIRTITERHVKDRLDQSFKLAQFIQEYRWLRKVIIAVVLEAEASEQALAGTAAEDEKAARVVTLARLNEVLDDSILDAVEWFVRERDRRLADMESTAERYRALAQLSPEAIFVHRGGSIEFANVAAARLLGATSNAVLAGRSLAELFEPAEYDAFRAQTDRLLHGETIVPKGELTITRSDGRPRLVEAVASLIDLPDGPVVEVVAREITDRKQAERLLREAHQRQTDFLAVLSHELRNPLAPIQNAVEIMRRVAPDSPQRGRALDVIDRQVTHLTELVSDLLDLSRINHDKITLARTRFDARDVVRLACDDIQATFAARGITLRSVT